MTLAENRNEWRARATLLAAIALAVIGLDQLTKHFVTRELVLGESVPLVPGLLHLTLVHNTGMAFGLLSGTDVPFKSLLVTLLSLLALGAVLYYALASDQGERWTRVGLGLVLGGALGNIVDRVRLGYVVDFVDVFYRGAHWPAFNVADSCICVGVGLLILDSLRHPAASTAADADVPVRARRGEG